MQINIENLTAIFSVVMAGISIIAAIYIHYDTSKAIKPFQKPILSLNEVKLSGEILDNSELKINLLMLFKNFGKGIATNIHIKVFAVNSSPQGKMELIMDKTIANEIYPEVFFNKAFKLNIPSDFYMKNGNKIVLKKEDIGYNLIIFLNYVDKFSKKIQKNNFWMFYKVGSSGAYHLTIEEKEKLLTKYPILKNELDKSLMNINSIDLNI